MSTMESAVIWLNRLRGRMTRRRYPAERVLLLLPHCLQNHACKAQVQDDIRNCKRCGKCAMKELSALAERLGVQVHVASGGREALARAQRPDVHAVLAVACTKELAEGIRAAFPKRVVGVLNSWPHGACKDTDVDVTQVEGALKSLIADSAETTDRRPQAAKARP